MSLLILNIYSWRMATSSCHVCRLFLYPTLEFRSLLSVSLIGVETDGQYCRSLASLLFFIVMRGGLNCSLLAWHVQVPKTMVNILSSCDSVSVLIWASAAGWLTSLVLVCGQGILTLPEAMETWMEGMKVLNSVKHL